LACALNNKTPGKYCRIERNLYWEAATLLCCFDFNAAMYTRLHRVFSRGGRSHFFRLRLRSCSNIFESGSGNFSDLRIRLLFRLRLQ